MAEEIVDPPHPFGPGNPPVNADVPAEPENDDDDNDNNDEMEG